MDVVAFEGDLVAFARDVERPVVVAVAGGGPVAAAVEFSIGYGDAGVAVVACYDVLAADAGDLGNVSQCQGLRWWLLDERTLT